MGISPFHNSICNHASFAPSQPIVFGSPQPKLPNPDPQKFNILLVNEHKGHTIAMVHYPDCINYEGVKILFFYALTAETVKAQTYLDPHFCDDQHISPFARFEPTQRGWDAALALADKIGI